MKTSFKRVFFILCFGLIAITISAQSAKWGVAPNYSSLERLNDHLFKVVVNGREGIVNDEGKIVIKPEMDKITPFAEGKSLALTNLPTGTAISGIISENGDIKYITDATYFVTEFDFFSEGFLPVYNGEGRFGYLDLDGNLAIPFEYSSARPFCEGFASVGIEKDNIITGLKKAGQTIQNIVAGKEVTEPVAYIDRFGMRFKLDKADKALKEINLGTSFYNGEAVVKTKVKKGFEYWKIAKDGRVLQKSINPDWTLLDWKFRLSGETRPEVSTAPDRNSPVPFERSERFGYNLKDGTEFLPAQFISASTFSGGYATAAIDGNKAGILQLINGSTSLTLTQGDAAEEGKENLMVYASLPEYYQDKEVNVLCVDSKGGVSSFPLPAGGDPSSRNTTVVLPDGKWAVAVTSEGLALAQKEITLETIVAVTATISVKQGQRADEKDRFPFTVTFTNNGPKEVTIPVSVTGSSQKSVTIPAGKKKYVTGYFTKVIKEETRTATVEYGKDNKTVTKAITVKPIF